MVYIGNSKTLTIRGKLNHNSSAYSFEELQSVKDSAIPLSVIDVMNPDKLGEFIYNVFNQYVGLSIDDYSDDIPNPVALQELRDSLSDDELVHQNNIDELIEINDDFSLYTVSG